MRIRKPQRPPASWGPRSPPTCSSGKLHRGSRRNGAGAFHGLGGCKALAPLVHTFAHAGALAELLFAIGILNVGLLAVPFLAGSSAYAVGEVAGWAEGLNLNVRRAHGFYGVIALGSLVGLAVNFVGLNTEKSAGRRGGSERDRGSP